MNMIILAITLNKLRFKVFAHFFEYAPEISDRQSRQDIPLIFRYKDQMNMKIKNTMPTSAIVHLDSSKTNTYIHNMINRGLKFKVYTSPENERLFSQWAGCARFVYNWGLDKIDNCQDVPRENPKKPGTHQRIDFADLCRRLTVMRSEIDWMRDCPIDVEQQALRNLDAAYSRFFKGEGKYPTPKKKNKNKDSFRIPQSRCGDVQILNAKWAQVRLPKVGLVKFRLTRPVIGKVKNITVGRDANDWHISFSCEIKHTMPDIIPSGEVGIDRGIANNIALSTGELLSMDKAGIRMLEERHKNVQRIMARRQRPKGQPPSKRWKKAKKHAARLKAKAARKRLHWQHQVTTDLARRNGFVVLEALKTANMSKSAKGTMEKPGKQVAQKAGLNREILNAAWFQFETILTYKVEERGGIVVKINPAYTSQTCNCCGSINRKNRENQAKFSCVDCGHEDHADINAALNILKTGTQSAALYAAK